MVEHQLKVICYNCDDKYFVEHNCKEQKLFRDISEDVSDEHVKVSPEVELPRIDDPKSPFDPTEFELLSSLNALTGFCSPQTLKLIGYIKHRKVTILVDSGNTHNFSHRCLSQEANLYIYAIKKI
jgi:hypothetical protein